LIQFHQNWIKTVRSAFFYQGKILDPTSPQVRIRAIEQRVSNELLRSVPTDEPSIPATRSRTPSPAAGPTNTNDPPYLPSRLSLPPQPLTIGQPHPTPTRPFTPPKPTAGPDRSYSTDRTSPTATVRVSTRRLCPGAPPAATSHLTPVQSSQYPRSPALSSARPTGPAALHPPDRPRPSLHRVCSRPPEWAP